MEQAPYYRITIEQPDGTVVEMNQFVNLQFSYGLNRGSTAQLTLSMKDSKLTELSSSLERLYQSMTLHHLQLRSSAVSPYSLASPPYAVHETSYSPVWPVSFRCP